MDKRTNPVIVTDLNVEVLLLNRLLSSEGNGCLFYLISSCMKQIRPALVLTPSQCSELCYLKALSLFKKKRKKKKHTTKTEKKKRIIEESYYSTFSIHPWSLKVSMWLNGWVTQLWKSDWKQSFWFLTIRTLFFLL